MLKVSPDAVIRDRRAVVDHPSPWLRSSPEGTMTANQRHQITSLYHAALARPPGDRAAFLADACADMEVRREVESLLRVGPDAGAALQTPALEPAAVGASSMDLAERSISSPDDD